MNDDTKVGGLGSSQAQTSPTVSESLVLTEKSFEQAKEGDFTLLRKIPKADCHAHGILSAPFSAYQKILGRAIEKPPEYFEGFEPFGSFISNSIFPINSLHQIIQILQAAIEAMITDGVVLAELSFDIRFFYNQQKKAVVDELSKLVDHYQDTIDLSFDLGAPREMLDESLISQFEEVLASGFFKTVDFYGNENSKLSDTHYQLIETLRAKGIRIKLHWGEQGSALLDELLRAKPDAIQHGIALAQLPFQDTLSNIPLHICPASNICLKYVKNYLQHPMSVLQKMGYTVTLGSDDYALFGKSLSEQYLELYKTGNFSIEDLEQIRRNGLDSRDR